MFRALYTAASGMNAQQLNLDNVANNLANTSTAGFRRRRRAVHRPAVSEHGHAGLGVHTADHKRCWFAGRFGHQTGCFRGSSASGRLQPDRQPARSRDSRPGIFSGANAGWRNCLHPLRHFPPGSQGNIVTADGNPLEPAITLPPDALSVTIGSDGTVSVTQPSQTQATQVGNIQLALFPNPGGLNSVGNNLMLATTASGDPIVGTPGGTEGLGSLQQGFRGTVERRRGAGIRGNDSLAAFLRVELASG